jgi:hypothetical protein
MAGFDIVDPAMHYGAMSSCWHSFGFDIRKTLAAI